MVLSTSTLCSTKGSRSSVFGEKPAGLFQPAAGIEQHVLARNFNAHPEIAMLFQILDNHLVGKVMHVDNHFANAEAAQPSQRNLQQRASTDFHQRLGAVIGQRPQPRPQSGGQHHRFHRDAFIATVIICPSSPVRRCRTTTFTPLRARKCFASLLRQINRAMLPASTAERHHQIFESAPPVTI